MAIDHLDDRTGDDRNADGNDKLPDEPYLPERDDDRWRHVFLPTEDLYRNDLDGELSGAAQHSGDHDDLPIPGEPSGQGASVYRDWRELNDLPIHSAEGVCRLWLYADSGTARQRWREPF